MGHSIILSESLIDLRYQSSLRSLANNFPTACEFLLYSTFQYLRLLKAIWYLRCMVWVTVHMGIGLSWP